MRGVRAEKSPGLDIGVLPTVREFGDAFDSRAQGVVGCGKAKSECEG